MAVSASPIVYLRAAPPMGYTVAVMLKDDTVKIGELVASMLGFLTVAGNLHLWLFQRPVVVTSGNDGTHAANSAHYHNRAVDLRAADKSELNQYVFLNLLVQIGRSRGVAVYDERLKLGSGHYHCELVE